MLKVGKLYSCKRYYLLLYPDRETVADVATTASASPPHTAAAAAEHATATAAALWTKKFKKPVRYCEPATSLLVLNTDNEYVEVLAGDRKGWIINREWLNIKEIV